MLKQRVKNKRLKLSSRNWINRQINDPYVIKAKNEGYRSRAAFKILEIQDKYRLINNNSIVLDLGAAPGGCSQVIAPICKRLVAVDILSIDPIPKVTFIQGNFLDQQCINQIQMILQSNKVDVILSDMAPNTCGMPKVDHLRIINLLEQVYEFSKIILNKNGSIVAKIFQGGASGELFNELKQKFNKVMNFKPKSSRRESSEIYLVATGFKN